MNYDNKKRLYCNIAVTAVNANSKKTAELRHLNVIQRFLIWLRELDLY